MANVLVTVVWKGSDRKSTLEMVEFSNGWFKFVDPDARHLGPFERPVETVDYVGPASAGRPPRTGVPRRARPGQY